MIDDISRIEKISWEKACKLLAPVNSELVDVIRELNPGPDFCLYKIRYYFGEEIIQKGKFYLPNADDQLRMLSDRSIPEKLQQALNYNLDTNPVCVVLDRSAELYIRLGEQVFPYRFLPAGAILGVWGLLLKSAAMQHPLWLWDMVAGSRSIFMVPKIANAVAHQRLQKDLNIVADAPKQLRDHWRVFREISNNQPAAQRWGMELLCFSKEWFECADQPGWDKLHNYFYKRVWQNSHHLMSHSFWNLIFSVVQQQTDIQTNAYATNTIKHLFGIGCGEAVGFEPAVNEEAAPIRLLQDAYVNGPYALKQYMPTIMVPGYYSRQQQLPMYFSQQYSTALEFSPKNNSRPSLIADLVSLKKNFERYQEGLLYSDLEIKDTEMYRVALNTSYQFLHEAPAAYNEIQKNSSLAQFDLRFNDVLCDTQNHVLAVNGNFIRACVKIG